MTSREGWVGVFIMAMGVAVGATGGTLIAGHPTLGVPLAIIGVGFVIGGGYDVKRALFP